MNGPQDQVATSQVAERYVARIEAHLVRLAQGRYLMGHLFAIELLARVARAESWEAQRQTEP